MHVQFLRLSLLYQPCDLPVGQIRCCSWSNVLIFSSTSIIHFSAILVWENGEVKCRTTDYEGHLLVKELSHESWSQTFTIELVSERGTGIDLPRWWDLRSMKNGAGLTHAAIHDLLCFPLGSWPSLSTSDLDLRLSCLPRAPMILQALKANLLSSDQLCWEIPRWQSGISELSNMSSWSWLQDNQRVSARLEAVLAAVESKHCDMAIWGTPLLWLAVPLFTVYLWGWYYWRSNDDLTKDNMMMMMMMMMMMKMRAKMPKMMTMVLLKREW